MKSWMSGKNQEKRQGVIGGTFLQGERMGNLVKERVENSQFFVLPNSDRENQSPRMLFVEIQTKTLLLSFHQVGGRIMDRIEK
jgi:hypothetical protein